MNAKRQAGFTLIELLIVSIIVGILGTLVLMSYSGVQSKNRNAERQAQIKTLQSQLETYYAQYSQYPTLDNLSDSSWRKKNLAELPAETLRDPQWSTDVVACTKDGAAVPSSKQAEKCYAYEVSATDGSVCDNDKAPCAQYTLTATLEGGDKYVKSSLN